MECGHYDNDEIMAQLGRQVVDRYREARRTVDAAADRGHRLQTWYYAGPGATCSCGARMGGVPGVDGYRQFPPDCEAIMAYRELVAAWREIEGIPQETVLSVLNVSVAEFERHYEDIGELLVRGWVYCEECGAGHPGDEVCGLCDREERFSNLLHMGYTRAEAEVEAMLGGG